MAESKPLSAEVKKWFEDEYAVSEKAKVILMEVMERYLSKRLAIEACNEFTWQVHTRMVDAINAYRIKELEDRFRTAAERSANDGEFSGGGSETGTGADGCEEPSLSAADCQGA